MYNSSKHEEQEVLAPTYCDTTHVLPPPSYSGPRKTCIQRLEFKKIIILLNILIITKNFIMFQVLM